MWSPNWEKVPSSASTPLVRLHITVSGIPAYLCAKMQLWFYFNFFYNIVCFILWVTGFHYTLSCWPDLQGLKNSKTYSLSYLKCCLTYYACGQALNLGSVQAGQKPGKGPALMLLKPEQDFLHFNFPNYWPQCCLDWKSMLLFSLSVVSDSLWPHGLQHARLPCSSPTPKACSNSCPSSWCCHPTISSYVVPF